MSGSSFFKKIVGNTFASVTFMFVAMVPSTAIADSTVPELRTNEKILGLSLIWMEVRRNFPFRERLKDLDADYLDSIEAVSATTDLRSYYRELQLFLAKLKDGHTFIRLPKGMHVTKSRPSIGVTRVGKNAVVTWARSDLLTDIPLGSVVELVDGVAYDVAAQKASESVSASSEHKRKDSAYVLAMEGEKNSVVTLQISTPQNGKRSVSLTRGQVWPEGTTLVSLDQDVDDVSFKWIENNNIAYLSLNSFANNSIYEKFLEHLTTLKLAKYIVIDLRNNSGGNGEVGYKIISHFLSQPVNTSASLKFVYDPAYRSSIKNQNGNLLNSPENIGMKSIEIPPDMIQPADASARLTGKLIVLTGHQTISAAEDFLVAASSIRHTRLGEHTAGSTGQPIVVQLPGGGAAYILSKIDTFPSGKKFVGIGIAPDVEISPTVEDVRSGRDVVIERMLEMIYLGEI